MDFRESFKSHMAINNIICDEDIISDGKLHRFHVEGDKQGSKNGWYVLHINTIPSGVFGSWKLGSPLTWSAKSKNTMSKYELTEHCRKINDARHQYEMDRLKQQKLTAKRASAIWNNSKPANPTHPYLLKKNIKPCTLRQMRDLLLVPLVDVNGTLHNIQIIDAAGKKRFLRNGRVDSVFSLLGELPASGCLYICEGFATAVTIRELTGNNVIAAMNAGNLKPVSLALRKALPMNVSLVIAADNDAQSRINTGFSKGRDAADATGAKLTWPTFPCKNCDCTDFNDLYNCEISVNRGGI